MNKTELSQRISGKMCITRKEALRFINTIEEVFKETLQSEDIIFLNFGTFSLWPQTERMGRNPKTGAPVPIKARNSVKFKPGKLLLEAINKPENKS